MMGEDIEGTAGADLLAEIIGTKILLAAAIVTLLKTEVLFETKKVMDEKILVDGIMTHLKTSEVKSRKKDN